MEKQSDRIVLQASAIGHVCGWHAARRGLGSNLYALGVPEKVIQQILRHANVSTTNTYYIKTVPAQVTDAMESLQKCAPRIAIWQQYGSVNLERHGIPCRQLAYFQGVSDPTHR